MSAVPRLDVPEELWHDTDGDRSRLRATAIIDDVLLHLEAVAVRRDRDLFGWLGSPELDTAYAACGVDGGWQTALIGGREYILHAVPHAA